MDIFYYFVAFLVVAGALGFGCCLLYLPIYLLRLMGRGSEPARSSKSIEDQVVDAQWRYDRIWRRRP